MNLSQLMNIQSVLDKAVKEKYLAGVNALVYKDGKEIGYWQSGYADVENNVPFSRSTISRMFSMTKTVTSVAAMTLIEEGKLDLAEEAGFYIPEFWNLQLCTEGGREGKPVKDVSDPEIIKKQYRKIMHLVHPDAGEKAEKYPYSGSAQHDKRLRLRRSWKQFLCW
mgnify:CR=1 FL=1